MGRWIDGWMDGRADRRTGGWEDGWMSRLLPHPYCQRSYSCSGHHDYHLSYYNGCYNKHHCPQSFFSLLTYSLHWCQSHPSETQTGSGHHPIFLKMSIVHHLKNKKTSKVFHTIFKILYILVGTCTSTSLHWPLPTTAFPRRPSELLDKLDYLLISEKGVHLHVFDLLLSFSIFCHKMCKSTSISSVRLSQIPSDSIKQSLLCSPTISGLYFLKTTALRILCFVFGFKQLELGKRTL